MWIRRKSQEENEITSSIADVIEKMSVWAKFAHTGETGWEISVYYGQRSDV